MIIVPQSVKLLSITENPELKIEDMARACYQSSHKVQACPVCGGIGARAFCGHCGGDGQGPQGCRGLLPQADQEGTPRDLGTR